MLLGACVDETPFNFADGGEIGAVYIKVGSTPKGECMLTGMVSTVKHEIFLVDVTACFNSLRKTFQDLALTNSEVVLQMNQPTLRSALRKTRPYTI